MEIHLKKFSFATTSVVKRSTVAILCIFVIGMFMTYSCDKFRTPQEDEPNINHPIEEYPIEEYPIEISIKKISFEGFSCQLEDFADNKPIIVNSMEEFGNYVNCENGFPPEIDFSKCTLLMARGQSSNGIYDKTATFIQNAENEYTLEVRIGLGITMFAQHWSILIFVPKIADDALVTLDVQYYY